MGKVRIIYFITRRKVKQYRKNHWITQNTWLDRMSNFENIFSFHNITIT